MNVKDAITQAAEQKLDAMRETVSGLLTQKAVDRLEAVKVQIGQEYFGNKVNEEDLQESSNNVSRHNASSKKFEKKFDKRVSGMELAKIKMDEK